MDVLRGMVRPFLRFLVCAAPVSLAGCASVPAPPPMPVEQFWNTLQSHCGNAYSGALVSEDARDADFRGRRMVAHWADCSEDRTAIAFHIEDPDLDGGWDRSRTWVVTRISGGLRLKHDHRHADGGEDAITQYGGNTLAVDPAFASTARAQDFPIDAETVALFLRPENRERLNVSLTNVWRLEADPAGAQGARFAYQLTRVNDPTRLFRVEFDASETVLAPPGAWGW
ncbi:MAG: hypothetical protein WBA68_05115 [Alteraurantiacibacter sp.]